MLRTVDKYFGKLVSESYGLSKFRSHLHFLWSLSRQPLLVYQMGKVGSSTIVESLQTHDFVKSAYSLYHVHWLDPNRLRQELRIYKEAQKRYGGSSLPRQRFFPRYAWIGEFLSNRIRRERNIHWKIITLARDPIARNISSFFQNLDTLLCYDYQELSKTRSIASIVHELVNLYNNHYLNEDKLESIDANPLTWFDKELKQVFDVDVFSSKFPVENGYEIYDTPRARVLLIRLEDLNKCYAESFHKFLGIENFSLVAANTGQKKAYSNIYEAFLREIHFSKAYIDEVYNSKYARHFYTELENKVFRSKWLR